MPSSTNADRLRALGLGGLATCLYLVSAPSVPNADGLGYLKLLPHNFAAGHLLYMPALRLVTRLCHGDSLRAGRLFDAILGGTGVVLFYGIVRRLVEASGRTVEESRFAATFAAAGLAVSFGYWSEANDVEAYAAATVALLATVRLLVAYGARPSLWRALGAGVALGVAVLCHLTHVLFAPFTAAFLVGYARPQHRGRVGFAHAASALAVGGALVIALYAWAALVVRGHDLRGALAWIATSGHGFREQGGVYRVAEGVYGLARAIVWAPYLRESNAPRLIGQFLLGLAPLVALGALAVVKRRARPPLDVRLVATWVLPYSLFALAFFASDCERWLFVLPLGWLTAGALVSGISRRGFVAIAIVAYLLVLNWRTGIEPAHRGTDGTRWRAETAAERLRDGDLVIFPGHSWDEYVSFYASARVEPFPLAYYAARDGGDACFARLARELAETRARGGRGFVARLFDDGDDDDRRGFDELAMLGLDRATLRRRVRALGATLTPDGPLARIDGP